MTNTHIEFGVLIPEGRQLCQQCMGKGVDVANPAHNYKSWHFIQCPICKGEKHVSINNSHL